MIKSKKISFLVIATLIFLLSSFDIYASMTRIATYNIWNPVFEEKYSGVNTWDKRLPHIVDTILKADSDILCLQEVSLNSYQDISQNPEIQKKYKSYYFSHAPSSPTQKEGRDGLAFFYNPEKAAVIQVVNSTDGTRPKHRRDFFVDLRIIQADAAATIRIASTHLDSGEDLAVGNAQLESLVQEVLKGKGIEKVDIAIVCGDFNEGEGESERPRYKIMQQAQFISDGSTLTTRPEALDVRHNGHVDWIYFKKLSPLNFDLIPLGTFGDEKGSDHKLTMTGLNFIKV